MNSKALFILLSLFAFPFQAAVAFDTYRVGTSVISVNDSVVKLEDLLGQPDHKEPVENRNGAHLGDYYIYKDGGKTVRFFVSGGLIVEIQESR